MMMIEEVFVEAHAAVQFLCPKRICISPKVRSSRHPVVHEEVVHEEIRGKSELKNIGMRVRSADDSVLFMRFRRPLVQRSRTAALP